MQCISDFPKKSEFTFGKIFGKFVFKFFFCRSKWLSPSQQGSKWHFFTCWRFYWVQLSHLSLNWWLHRLDAKKFFSVLIKMVGQARFLPNSLVVVLLSWAQLATFLLPKTCYILKSFICVLQTFIWILEGQNAWRLVWFNFLWDNRTHFSQNHWPYF